AQANQDSYPVDIAILPADDLVFLQISYVIVWLIRVQLEKQPSDMRIKEAFRDTVRIIVMIHVLVMASMFARPHQDRILKRASAKDKCEKPDRPGCLKGNMREKPMVA